MSRFERCSSLWEESICPNTRTSQWASRSDSKSDYPGHKRLVRTDESVAIQALAPLPPSTIFTTAVTRAEILYGLELMPRGRKRELLHRATAAMFQERFPNRVLPFGADCGLDLIDPWA